MDQSRLRMGADSEDAPPAGSMTAEAEADCGAEALATLSVAELAEERLIAKTPTHGIPCLTKVETRLRHARESQRLSPNASRQRKRVSAVEEFTVEVVYGNKPLPALEEPYSAAWTIVAEALRRVCKCA